MERKRPATQKGLSEALRRRVDHLDLSAEVSDRILASAHPEMPPKGRCRPSLALAAAACLLIAVLGVVRLRTSTPAPHHSRIKCVSVVYADESRSVWLKRTVIVREANGMESYIRVVAHNSRRKERTT